jgi:HEAT repeat protein
LGDPAARSALQAALDDPEERVRELAHAALAEGDVTARGILVSRIAYAGPSAEMAATALALTAPKEAAAAVLAALAAEGASERPALRDALSASCEQLKTACAETVRAWLGTAVPKVPARAAVALALSHQHGLSGVPELVAELIVGASAEAKGFEERWRLVNAAPRAAASAPLDGWLAELVAKEERWMLRATALSALSQRKSALVASTAKQALKDEYPRVRLVAVQALADDASATADLAIHAQRDRWPMVRSAAYDALAKHAGMRSSVIKTLEGGVSDPAKSVRASALRALTTARVITAWPVVEKVLRNDNEWSEVTIEAAGYARALCVQAAREPLVALLVRALKPDAAPFEAEVGGPVFEALSDLGGEAAAAAQKVAARSTSPAGLKAMAKRAAAHAPACAAQPAAPAPAM